MTKPSTQQATSKAALCTDKRRHFHRVRAETPESGGAGEGTIGGNRDAAGGWGAWGGGKLPKLLLPEVVVWARVPGARELVGVLESQLKLGRTAGLLAGVRGRSAEEPITQFGRTESFRRLFSGPDLALADRILSRFPVIAATRCR